MCVLSIKVPIHKKKSGNLLKAPYTCMHIYLYVHMYRVSGKKRTKIHTYTHILMHSFIHACMDGDVFSVMVIIVGFGLGDQSSIPRWGCLCFTSC